MALSGLYTSSIIHKAKNFNLKVKPFEPTNTACSESLESGERRQCKSIPFECCIAVCHESNHNVHSTDNKKGNLEETCKREHTTNFNVMASSESSK